MPHQHVAVSQTGFQGRTHDDHDHLKVHRLNDSLPTDKSHYLLATFIEVHVGEPIPSHYPGPAVVYVIKGELHLDDTSKPGEITKLVAGDVVHIDQGTFLTATAPSYAKVLGVSYAPSTHHPEDYIVKK